MVQTKSKKKRKKVDKGAEFNIEIIIQKTAIKSFSNCRVKSTNFEQKNTKNINKKSTKKKKMQKN